MILDRETFALANAIEALVEAYDGATARSSPSCCESVLEIATQAVQGPRARRATQLRGLRRQVSRGRRRAAGSRSARPARTRSRSGRTSAISGRPRYRDLIAALRFVARQEIIFGLHVHVGIDDADKAIHVANGMRVHVPILLALSRQLAVLARATTTGLASTRMPIFRAFPRVGIPPLLRGLGRLRAAGSASWSTSGVMEDYTYLWYDVRPHPNFGTVEIRAMDAQTRVEHTLGAGGADPGDGQGARRALRGGQAARRATRTRCSTRTSGWPRATGSRASSSTCPSARARADQGARAAALRPPARARAGPRLGRRARGDRRPARARQRRRTASASSTRRTTTSARSCSEIVAATAPSRRSPA